MQKQYHLMRDFGDNAKQKFEYLQGAGAKMSRNAVKTMDRYAQKKPWYMIGIFSAVAAFFAFFVGRSSKGLVRRYSNHNHKRR